MSDEKIEALETLEKMKREEEAKINNIVKQRARCMILILVLGIGSTIYFVIFANKIPFIVAGVVMVSIVASAWAVPTRYFDVMLNAKRREIQEINEKIKLLLEDLDQDQKIKEGTIIEYRGKRFLWKDVDGVPCAILYEVKVVPKSEGVEGVEKE